MKKSTRERRSAPTRRRTRAALVAVFALIAAGTVVALIGARRLAPRPVAASAATPARWAAPESDAERDLIGRIDEAGGRVRLAEHYLAQSRPFAAAWELNELLQQTAATDGEARNRITIQLARALRQGQWHAASERLLLPHAGQGAARSTEEREAAGELAALYLATGRPEMALKVLPPDDFPARGDAEFVAGRLRQAADAYSAASRRSPSDAEPLFRLGRLALHAGDVERALEQLQRAATIDPRDTRFGEYQARALLRRGRPADLESAGRQLLALTEVSPNSRTLWRELGRVHLKARRWRESGRAFLKLLELDPGSADAHRHLSEIMAALDEPARAQYHLGWSFVFQDRAPDAVAAFRAMAAADPANVEAPLLVSQGYTQMYQETRGAEVVKSALARHPQDPGLLARLTGLYYVTHNRRGTLALCEEWLKTQPDAADPLWMQGKLAVADHRLDEGIALFRQAIGRAPSRADIQFDLGEALARRPSPENLRDALAALGRAVELAPGQARYRYQLGMVLQRMGEQEGARRQFLRCLDLDPRVVEAVNGLVQTAQAVQRPEQAGFWAAEVQPMQDAIREESDLWRRIGRAPKDADAEFRMAGALLRRGALKKARGHMSRAVALAGDRAEWREALSRLERTLAVLGDD